VKNANKVALGFRAHSGWAAAVALGGSPRSPEVIDRRRISLIEPGSPGRVQPYHAARTMALPKAEEFIAAVIVAIDHAALLAVRVFAEAISGPDHSVASCGIVLASGRALPSLESTLRSHAMVHTAEGELYRSAIAKAAKHLNLQCVRVPERDLYQAASKHFGISAPKLKTRITEMGRTVGTPWSADEKCATLVAWLSLAGFEASEQGAGV
jgi:hypothetical protein